VLKWGGVNSQTRVVCDLQAAFTDIKEVYFTVDEEYGDWLTTDVYDAFLVAMIYPALYYDEPIEIDGCVTKRLYFNIKNYIWAIVRDYAKLTGQPKRSIKPINVSVKGFATAAKNARLHVGCGFSGGVDSFATLQNNFFDCTDDDYRIDALFFFHIGQYGDVNNPLTRQRADNRFQITQRFAEEIVTRAIMMNSNIFDIFQHPSWEYTGGVLFRIASVLVFQRALRRYYISGGCSYYEHTLIGGKASPNPYANADMTEFCDHYIIPMLSPDGLDIVCDGDQYMRSEKVALIANNPFAQRWLNVCVNSNDDHTAATNCGFCSKCMRTLVAIESVGALDKFGGVFDIAAWKRLSYKYKCLIVAQQDRNIFYKDNVNFAKQHGNPLPSRPVAVVMTCAYRAFSRLLRLIPDKTAVRMRNFVKRL